jgi:hypothetical protein
LPLQTNHGFKFNLRRYNVAYVEHFADVPEEAAGADCTCVWRFELSAEEGFDPPVALGLVHAVACG